MTRDTQWQGKSLIPCRSKEGGKVGTAPPTVENPPSDQFEGKLSRILTKKKRPAFGAPLPNTGGKEMPRDDPNPLRTKKRVDWRDQSESCHDRDERIDKRASGRVPTPHKKMNLQGRSVRKLPRRTPRRDAN